MTISEKFQWKAIDDAQFEELILAIVKSKSPIYAEFRKGPGDKGRDIQAAFRHRDQIGIESDNTYFFEAKHHTNGVSPDHLSGALAWSQAEQPHTLVLASSSHFTTPCRDNIEAWKRNNPRISVALWERHQIEDLILSNQAVKAFAVSLGLLPPDIESLLPAFPERYRPEQESDLGLEMSYRYWLTEDDLEQLETAASFIECFGDILSKHGLSMDHFETACLGVPNWSTALRLFRAECSLELSIRDYLFGQASKADSMEMQRLAQAVSERVTKLNEIGQNSFHVD